MLMIEKACRHFIIGNGFKYSKVPAHGIALVQIRQMRNDHPYVFHSWHRLDENLIIREDAMQPFSGASGHHPRPHEIQSTAKNPIGIAITRIPSTVGMLPDYFRACFQNVVSIAPEDIIASRHFKGLLPCGGEVIEVRPCGMLWTIF